MKSIKKIAAIFAIILSAYATMFFVTIVMNEFESVRDSGFGNFADALAGVSLYKPLSSAGYILAVIGFLLNVVILVLGCLFCKERQDKGISIALLAVVIVSIITLLAFAGEYKDYGSSVGGMALVYTLLMSGVIILTAFYLVMVFLGKVNFASSTVTITADSAATTVTAAQTACTLLDAKINALKQLKADGTITDAEYKKRVLEAIDAK